MYGDKVIAEGDAPLSQRERDTLTLAAQGETSRSIAAALGISDATVRTHLAKAAEKLAAKTTAHAIAIAIQRGLIDITDSKL